MIRLSLLFALFILTLSSCGQKSEEKYMYYGLSAALKEKDPSKVLRLTLIQSDLDSVPTELNKFPNLIDLDLSFNHIRQLPDWISNLKNLQFLNLQENLIDTLTPSLFRLINLQELNLNHNKLRSLPLGFSDLKSLKSLNIGLNYLTDLPPDFSKLDSLTFLAMEHVHFKNLPVPVYGLKSLMRLHLYDNDISKFSNDITQLKTLRELDFSSNYVSLSDTVLLHKLLPECKLYYDDEKKQE